MWIILPTLRLSARPSLDLENFLSGKNSDERQRGNERGSKETGGDDEELQRILLVFQAGGKNRGFFFYQSSWSSVTVSSTWAGRRCDEADSCRFEAPVGFPQLGETTSNYLPVNSDHVRRTRRVPQGSNPYIRATVSVATEGFSLALVGRLALSATFGFRATTLSFFWMVLGFLVAVTLLGTPVSTRTNQCLEGNMQMSQGLVDFSFVGCFGVDFWFTDGEQTRWKKTDHWAPVNIFIPIY